MRGRFIFGIIVKSFNETKRDFKNMQSDYVLGSRDTSRVAIQWKTISSLWQIAYDSLNRRDLLSIEQTKIINYNLPYTTAQWQKKLVEISFYLFSTIMTKLACSKKLP